MLDISFHYKTKRAHFGRQFNPEDTNVRMIAAVNPDPDLRANFEEINPFSIDVQTAVTYSQHIVNTEVTQTKTEDVVHREGSWPQGIDPTDAPSCKQQRLKAEKREGFIKQLKELASTTEKTTKLNVALDLYGDHFPQQEQPTAVTDPSIRTITILRDKFTDRYISDLSWSDTGPTKRVAICYTPNVASDHMAHYESFIYNLECSSVPEMELHPSSPLVCLEYNTKDSNFLVGGMAHGSISLWDVRAGSLPVWTSAIEGSHRGAVYSIKWISAKTAFECVSTSDDGTTMTWDTRNQTTPLETIHLAPAGDLLPAGFSPPFGGRIIEYHTGVPTKYMVGTVEGLVMTVNRKAADPNSRISGVFSSHYGPIYAVRRHPTETKYFLTVSDWSVRVFTEDNKTPLLNLPPQRNYLTNAVWGQGRTSVIFTASNTGAVQAWDIIQSHKEPVCSLQVGTAAIRTMATEVSGEFIMTGDANGTATLLQLNDPLRMPQSAIEKAGFISMLSREAKRVKNYDQFLKEQKMREKAKAKNVNEEEVEVPPTFDAAELEEEFENALQGIFVDKKEVQRVMIGVEDEQPVELPPPPPPPPQSEEPEEEILPTGGVSHATDDTPASAVEERRVSPPKEEEEKPADEGAGDAAADVPADEVVEGDAPPPEGDEAPVEGQEDQGGVAEGADAPGEAAQEGDEAAGENQENQEEVAEEGNAPEEAAQEGDEAAVENQENQEGVAEEGNAPEEAAQEGAAQEAEEAPVDNQENQDAVAEEGNAPEEAAQEGAAQEAEEAPVDSQENQDAVAEEGNAPEEAAQEGAAQEAEEAPVDNQESQDVDAPGEAAQEVDEAPADNQENQEAVAEEAAQEAEEAQGGDQDVAAEEGGAPEEVAQEAGEAPVDNQENQDGGSPEAAAGQDEGENEGGA